jgi:predicted O-linked N-acetylglucosamine transferase (SPINDLY family)
LALNRQFLEALLRRGIVLMALKRHGDALASFDAALALKSGDAETWNNRGNALLELNRLSEALASFDDAVALNPNHADMWNNRGVALRRLQRHGEALDSFGKALAIKPDHVRALSNRGGLFILLKRFEDAIPDYEKVLSLDPDYPYAPGNLLQCRLQCCDWRSLKSEKAAVLQGLEAGKPVITPFQFVAWGSSAAEHLRSARLWVEHEGAALSAPRRREKYRHQKIRVAYLSADFRMHATAFLMAGVFESHDRGRFETTAVSFGADDRSAMRARLEAAFDRFIDVRNSSDTEVAELLREREIDLAVDLKGYTADGRPGILAQRPAPVQAHYLGYPGTMAADYVDYIIADKIVIPDEHRRHYTERIAYLPDTYQCNDSKRAIARVPRRREAGLQEDAFVFCCFNNGYKFSPEIFDVWMRLLQRVDNSVLWLLQDNSAAMRNLRREADGRGVSPERLVFAARLAPEEHLARQSLADLFLDTLPCNAHTTCSDALWAGVPVVTVAGATFAGRVAASLLNAIGLSELVSDSLEAYERRVLKLARSPSALAAIRAKLAHNRETHPLFDTKRFSFHLEAALEEMWACHQRGEEPRDFHVPPASL